MARLWPDHDALPHAITSIKLKDARKILLLGEGDGRFLLKVLELSSSSQVTCIDSSFYMLNKASERIKSQRPRRVLTA